MCSRYELNARPRDVARRFGLVGFTDFPEHEEIRPTNRTLVIAAQGSAQVLSWGIPSPWDAKPLINARSETLDSKKTFRALLDNRCLVPATAYFEWRRDGRARFKNRIAPAHEQPFAFAGLYDDGHFTIITCEPTPEIAHIHGRMPVILDRTREAQWIDPTATFADIRHALIPFTKTSLSAVETQPTRTQGDLFD
ncbi:MAG: SOS response-associated peptidase [Alphaproteobacteria bacterium]|nr:SOS response-associated peptidase [Alphaproteobacteria bacterium]